MGPVLYDTAINRVGDELKGLFVAPTTRFSEGDWTTRKLGLFLFFLHALSISNRAVIPAAEAERGIHAVQSARASAEHNMERLKNFSVLQGMRAQQVAKFEDLLDCCIAVHHIKRFDIDVTRRVASTERMEKKLFEDRIARSLASLPRIPRSTPRSKWPTYFEELREFVTGLRYLEEGKMFDDGESSSADGDSASPQTSSPAQATRSQREEFVLRRVVNRRGENLLDSAHCLHILASRDGQYWNVAFVVSASFLDVSYWIFLRLGPHGIVAKVCACSQGKNACAHFKLGLEVLRRLRSGYYDSHVVVRRRPRGNLFEKLRNVPLTLALQPGVVKSHADLLYVSEDELSAPYDQTFCVCGTHVDKDLTAAGNVKSDTKMIGCEWCDEWFCKSCVNAQNLTAAQIEEWICGFCTSEEVNENGEAAWTIDHFGRSNGKARTFFRHPDDTPRARKARGDDSSGYDGPRTWRECVEWAKREAARNRKKTKQYKDSAEYLAKVHQENNTGHHLIDSVSGTGNVSRSGRLTREQVEDVILLEK